MAENGSLGACLDRSERSSDATAALDGLQQWMQGALRHPEPSSLPDQLCDPRLLSILWHHLSSDRKLISARAKACLEASLDVLEKSSEQRASTSVATTRAGGKRAGKVRRAPPSPEPAFLSNLVKRTLEHMERRSSLVVLEILQSRYGIGYILSQENELYERLLQTSLHTVDSSKRAKLSLAVLEHQGRQLGVFAEEGCDGTLLADVRRRWCESWTTPMCREMADNDEKRLHTLCAYHLPPLLQRAPWALLPLVNAFFLSKSAMTLLAVLQCAKELDLCRLGTSCRGVKEVLLGDTSAMTYLSLVIVIPPAVLEPFLTSSSAQAQSSALSILIESRSLTSTVSDDELRLTRLLITNNYSQSSPDLRQTTLVKLNKLLLRLKAVSHVANHALIKARERGQADLAERERTCRDVIQQARTFLLWLFRKSRHATHPGAPYHSTRTGINHLELLLLCGVDARYTAQDRKMGRAKASIASSHSWPFSLPLVSPWLVTRLLECDGSTYFDIQQTARDMLLCLPSPLPAVDEKELANSLLQRARELMLSPREFQSEAGASLSSLYLELYVKRLDWEWTSLSKPSGLSKAGYTNRHLLFIHEHLCLLHHLLEAARQQESRTTSVERRPLHGTLITLQRLVSSLDVEQAPESEVQRIVQDILVVVDRTWEVTRGILCSSAPEGSTSGEVDHEIARALEEVGDEDDGVDGGEFSSTPRYQILLTFSWRGMKEASALLGAVVTKTLSLRPEKSKAIWRAEELENVGRRFNNWMSLVRHRGAYSTIYPAYSAASAALIRSRWSPVDDYPLAWLSHFLALVAAPDVAISTTRRSAGIGFAVLAILCSFPRASNVAVLSRTIDTLISIVEANPSQSSQIHALNILRVLVADGNLAESVEASIGVLFTLVIPRFTSESWHIRNASMMLFSELTIRAFGNIDKRGGGVGKVDWHDFFIRFPGLDTVLFDGLDERSIGTSTDVRQSSLFAVLLVLSKLQVFIEDESGVHTGQVSTRAFADRIEDCLQSQIWKVCTVARDGRATKSC